MSRSFTRRSFLRLTLISGAVAGCSQVAKPPPPGSASPAALAARFRLENDSISYQPHPRGCDQTTIRGSVRAADGAPLPGLTIRLWEENLAQATTVTTDGSGFYAIDVAQGLTDKTFRLQLLDSTGAPVSDVIVAAAIPDCGFNSMTVNFIPTP